MKTTVEILNKIANKLGDENADQYTTVAQALGSIANALGDSEPDKIQTVPEALEEILAVAGGGSSGGAYIVHLNAEDGSLDKKYSEIKEQFDNNVLIVIPLDYNELSGYITYRVTNCQYTEYGYEVTAYYGTATTAYYAETEDGYPVED